MKQAIYGGLLMISVIYLLLLLVKFRKHISMYYTLLSVSVVFVNLAYLLSSAAQTLETALADVFDALVSKRVYKEQFSYDRAFSIIGDSAASHFDPALCQRFLECRPRIEKLYDSYHD